MTDWSHIGPPALTDDELATMAAVEDPIPLPPPTKLPRPFSRGDHVELAERLVTDRKNRAEFVYADGSFYQYTEQRGVYRIVEHAELSRVVQGYAGERVGEAARLRIRAADVHGAIKLASDQAADPAFFVGAAPGVAFANAFVRVSDKAVEALPHSEDHRARFGHPFDYTPSARPKKLLDFFDTVFRDDNDIAEKVALVQEYLGICQLGIATMFQKALVLSGDGSNGKGVLMHVAEKCMPPGSVCSIPPHDIGQEYRRAFLAGKLLNIVSELPEGDILDSEAWKAIVAGDTSMAREIRKDPFTFRPIAGHIYSANRLPGTTDHSHGFWRRLIMVPFNRIFGDEEQDPKLAAEIVACELPQVVSWSLDGARRVLERGRLIAPASSTGAIEAWRRSADQVRAFVEERTTKLPVGAHPASGTEPDRLYRAYKTWAEESGHRPVAKNKLAERMRLLGLDVHRGTAGARHYPVTLGAE